MQLYNGLILFAVISIDFLITPNNPFVTASDEQVYIFESHSFVIEIYHLATMIANLFEMAF